ncbi:TetR/AcrR family transcriptional regulator [Streptomyces sp. NPDC020801]|uniref:TetR/AcrR family transcriptional regulator n=1 Tax=unclassified Streptomyces TaxID=2593676 RepID=UPI00378F8EBE
MAQQEDAARRTLLNRDRVLRAAVAFADHMGIEALSMRSLAQELSVVPMALYKHVANKEQLLDGMVDVVVSEIDPPAGGGDWRKAVRRRILSARRALLRHPWASRVIESRTHPTPAVLDYLDSLIGMFRSGGLSADLTHHVMHALGSRVWGFTPELFPTSAGTDPDAEPDADPSAQADAIREMAAKYPHIVEIATARPHDSTTAVGSGCDDQFEFEFALDLLLDGCERLHRQGWTSAGRS